MHMHPVYMAIDPYIIWFFRLTGISLLDFLVGTFLLALAAVAVGEFTISLAFLANRKAIQKQTQEVVRYQNISVDAVEAGDKEAYKASNKMANEAFGKSFFQQIALSTGFLWPIPFALGWMQCRFSDVDFALGSPDITVGYIFVFAVLYAGAYIVFKRIKKRIPYFRKINLMLEESAREVGPIRSFADLLDKSATNKR